MKKQYWIYGISGLVIASIILGFYLHIRSLKSDIMYLHNLLAEKVGIEKVNDTLYTAIAKLKKKITTKNNYIENLSARIYYYSSISMKRESIPFEIEKGKGSDKQYYPFYWRDYGITLDAVYSVVQERLSGNIEFDPINIKLWLTQNEHGLWQTTVQTSNRHLIVSDIYAEVSPYNFDDIEKNWFLTASILGGKITDGYRLGVSTLVGYKTYGLNLGYDNLGLTFGVGKLWRF